MHAFFLHPDTIKLDTRHVHIVKFLVSLLFIAEIRNLIHYFILFAEIRNMADHLDFEKVYAENRGAFVSISVYFTN